MNRILIVEDDLEINKLLADFLTENGYETKSLYNGLHVLDYMRDNQVDLVLLDLMLPYRSGDMVLAGIREQSSVPVIILSAKETTRSKIDLLRLGADDYMTKPFALEELEARIRVQLRRRNGNDNDALRVNDLTLCPDQRTLLIHEQPVTLTRHEYRIMELLMQYPKRAFSKKEIYEYAWEDIYAADDKTVSVHISNIRNKCRGAEIIDTIWGIGFKLY